MKKSIRDLFHQWPRLSLRRFPLGLAASLAAAEAAIALNHIPHDELTEVLEGRLARVLLLWPFALFGNVACTLRAESRHRSSWPGLAGLLLLLIAGWFLLPANVTFCGDAFWIAYGFGLAAWLAATATLTSTPKGTPTLWDTGWSIVQAAFMATLAAMLLVGGINAALFSIEKLFGLNIDSEYYFDMAMTGFFVIGPLTAFTWLPRPFGEACPQPVWIKGAARILLLPLCSLYALILILYLAKTAIQAHWPDGWVAMPTLIFAAIGLIVYVIIRQTRKTTPERWATGFCRLFPVVLIPLSLVLLAAMHVRVHEYGFTEWRVAGIYLGGWILLLALFFTVRQDASTWWIAASLTLLLAAAAVGPVSLGTISVRSQQARVLEALDALGVWGRPQTAAPIEIRGPDATELKSSLQYLLNSYRSNGLPPRVAERWSAYRKRLDIKTWPKYSWQWRNEADAVLAALGIIVISDDPVYFTIHCNDEPLPLGNASQIHIIRYGQHTNALFSLNNGIQLMAKGQPVATNETEAFIQHIKELQKQAESTHMFLSPENMAFQFEYEGKQYRILFTELTHSGCRQEAEFGSYKNWNGITLIIEE